MKEMKPRGMVAGDKKFFGSIEAADMIGIELHRLYGWERHGIVRPIMKDFRTRHFRRYSSGDIERAKFVKQLVDEEGYTLLAAVRKLKAREAMQGANE